MLDTPLAITSVLAPVRRRLGLGRLAGWLVRGLAGGALAALALLALAHLEPFGAARPLALAAIGLGILAGLIRGAAVWPSWFEAARTADHSLHLEDRLTTALELGSPRAALSRLQLADCLRAVQGLPRRTGRIRVAGREVLVALAVLAACLIVLRLAPGRPPPAPASSDHQRIAQVSGALPALRRQLDHHLPPALRGTTALRRLDAALARLRAQLAHARSRADALRDLSATQQQLGHLAAGLHPISPHVATLLNRDLGPQPPSPATRSGTRALEAAAQTLDRLARQVRHMSPRQRARLARLLERAANSTPDAATRHSLQQAASSLGYNDPQRAVRSLRQAAAALGNSPAQRQLRSRLLSARGHLAALKHDVAPFNPSQADQPAGIPGNGRAKGSGRGQYGSRGSHSAPGSGMPGQGKGKSSGTSKPGQGTGRSTGGGSTSATVDKGKGGSAAAGGRGIAGPRKQGKYTKIYLPGRQHSGAQITGMGPNGQPISGQILPYQQVIAAYRRQARAALDHSALTPAQQQIVLRYFSSIAP